MNILLVSSFLPYPLFSGGHVRLYNILKKLAKCHSVTLICEKRAYQTQTDIEEVEKICKKVIWVERKKQWSFSHFIKTAFSFYPFLLVGHSHEEMKRKIDEELGKGKTNAIHVETFYVMQNIPSTMLPIVLVEHNIEYLVYRRFIQMVPLFLRPLLSLDVFKLKYWEELSWKKATKLVAVSEEEKKLMNRSDVAVVPNGVDLEKFKVESSKLKVQEGEKRILFIGDFRWIQNRDAITWLIKEIWPMISSKFPAKGWSASGGKVQSSKFDLKLWVVGKNMPGSIKLLGNGNNNIILDENASDDTAEIFSRADVLVAPIRVGGGTSFKILESMAVGTPVVTTSLGIEGIRAVNGKEVLIGDDPQALAKHIRTILEEKDLYERLAKNARKLVEEQYNWEVIVGKLEETYQEAIKAKNKLP